MAAKQFAGARSGFAFKKGSRGVGYYTDKGGIIGDGPQCDCTSEVQGVRVRNGGSIAPVEIRLSE